MKQTPEQYILSCMELLFYAPKDTKIVEDDGTLMVGGLKLYTNSYGNWEWVGNGLNLRGCTSLTSLPEGIVVRGDLNLRGCTSLTSLPEGIVVQRSKTIVRGDLNLRGCTSLTSLPDNLEVEGDLNLRGCTSLTSLPKKLRVEGKLDLRGCTSLTSLPKGLKVRREIYIEVAELKKLAHFLPFRSVSIDRCIYDCAYDGD